MPISHSDRISGTIYAIAQTAERAGDIAIDYLRNKDGESEVFGVFDHQVDADKAMLSRRAYSQEDAFGTGGDRVYAISLDIRVADKA
ncbi:hypothetical protein [Streptomyces sp. NPDC096351]|uniref:hypothetical protein n=1 Tax=Streptomyces sp. NPDC096351 TaxID=3366087 RepID=UPI00380270C4